MQTFLQIVASNALLVVVLAAGVTMLGRIWKNPLCLHLLWLFVLLKLVTPPLVTVPVPLPERQAPPAIEESATSRPLAAPSRVEIPGRTAAPATVDVNDAIAVHSHENRVTAESQAPPSSVDAVSANIEGHGMTWLMLFGWAWGVGIVVCASARVYRILSFRRLLRSGEAASCEVLGMAAGIAKRLGLRRVPEILTMPVCMSPLVWSLGGRPRVILPAALFERLDGAAREAILAHEFAHVVRKDHWVRLLEMVVTTLFWWHPVVWWAARQLQELEDQCCDAMVLGSTPQAAKSYATALLDTLDFLSDRSIAAPLGATAAKSSTSLARRIGMLKNPTPAMRLTVGRAILLAAVVAVPMALAFGAKPPQKGDQPLTNDRQSAEKPAVERRVINKLVKDFPEKTDLSTPESALAAYERACANKDAKALWKLGRLTAGPREIEETQRFLDHDGKDTEAYRNILLNTEVIEVLTYRDDLAEVISKSRIKVPAGAGPVAAANPYSSRSFGRIDGVWTNLGEDRLPSVEVARKQFDEKKDGSWRYFVKVRDNVKHGRSTSTESSNAQAQFPSMAPGEPLGISVEKADLMGRIEWAMMHGGRDITARKSIEWGDIKKDDQGNRTIRYKYYATIWDKDVYIMNQVFTFDAKGNMLKMEHVEGYPKKKVVKPVDVTTQKGMKELVEDFFSKNFRDVTSRETIEWGKVTKTADGNSSIRYKYLAKIWDKDTMIMNQVFTFDPNGQYVSYKNVERFPQKKEGKPVDVTTRAGMKELVEDFFHHNFRDIASHETIEWGNVAKAAGDNFSIRYKYRAKVRGNVTMIMNQVFTFDPKGKFVSVKDIEGFPQ